VSSLGGQRPPAVPLELLRPYFSVLLLRSVDSDPARGFVELADFLADSRRTGPTRVAVTLVGSGLGDAALAAELGFDDILTTVHRVEQRPAWLRGFTYTDVSHELTVALRKGDLVAVHAVGSVREALQRWLDKPPRPPFRRLPSSTLEGALLQGETKSLWLRGTHSRRATKADGKNIVGTDLRAALSAFEDGTFAMSSARSSLQPDPDRKALRGTVGTTPHASLVWNRQTTSLAEFVSCVGELMEIVDRSTAASLGGAPVFPLLAQRVVDLVGVAGAYEVSCLDPGDLAAIPGSGPSDSDERTAAAELLLGAVLEVKGAPRSADFELTVRVDDVVVAELTGHPRSESGRIRLGFDHRLEPPDPTGTATMVNALESSDLVTVYYASGHAISGDSLFRPRINPMPFPNWSFQDLAGYDIKQEKPRDAVAQRIHAMAGADEDHSLFGWCVRHFADGWLTCDDGSGEIADFVHVARDGTLNLVHVKAAMSRSRSRGISASAFEVVLGQAVKNIMFLEPDRLLERLRHPPVASPACWRDGKRVTGRTEIVRAIADRDVRDHARVVIVQPHVSKANYDRLYTSRRRGGPPSPDMLRLHRVENMLNSSRPSITGVGADLAVLGALQ
jgi:hypothetical protein